MEETKEREVAIEVSHLCKSYKLYEKPSDRMKEALHLGRKNRHSVHEALRDVDLKVYKGETVGIIGTNGSGKSTILKIITGVLSPTSGSVNVKGRISALLELGAGFNMEYNGIENIYLNGTMIGFSKKEIDEKLQAILDFADIGEYVYQPCKTYSSGMFVRLAFALAINIEPEILIVDEALSVGDVFFQAKCYHKFEEFKEQGKTILLVSHDLSSISKYCDRAVLLNKGVKLGEGTPKAMIDDYKRVLVGQYPLPDFESKGGLLEDEDIRKAAGQGQNSAPLENGSGNGEKSENGETDRNEAAKNGAVVKNPNSLEYGNQKATIESCSITDDHGIETSSVLKNSEFSIHMKVRFHEDIAAPIFAFTFKNVLGIEITGTNSMVEKAFLEPVKKGDVKEITFTQVMNLQGGDYLLSLGVTGFEGDTFVVYHRLYDAINLTVVSDKNTVGYYDMNSRVTVQ